MNNLVNKDFYDDLYADIKKVLISARNTAVITVNTTMIQAYWAVGKLIVNAQGGKYKAAYGDNLLNVLSTRLTAEFGKGFDSSNLRRMRQLYLSFPICDTVCHKLSWSHIRHVKKMTKN